MTVVADRYVVWPDLYITERVLQDCTAFYLWSAPVMRMAGLVLAWLGGASSLRRLCGPSMLATVFPSADSSLDGLPMPVKQ
jgi:hypothetical protein